MKKFLREPLLHFLVLGVAIFVVYGALPKRVDDDPAKIVITQGQIEAIIIGFARTWQRPPTADELQYLIRDRVREEVYYREALALGLDKDDTIVRRRLRQKLEFLTEDTAAQTLPTEDDLAAFLTANAEQFRTRRRWNFSHVYLNPQKHGASLGDDALQLLARLGRGVDISAEGDPFLLGHDFANMPAEEVAKLFGDKFAKQLDGLASGKWQGPIESGYGVHLVYVDKITDGRMPALGEVRDAVVREWAEARRRQANEKRYEAMLRGYVVIVEPARAANEPGPPVAKSK